MGFYGGIWVIIFETAKLLGLRAFICVCVFIFKNSIQSQGTTVTARHSIEQSDYEVNFLA